MREIVLHTAILLVFTLAMPGCWNSDSPRISGQVTLDGKPLENGAISFLPVDGKGPSSGGLIVDGRYTLGVTPGTKRIEIRGFKSQGARPYDETDPRSPLVEIQEPIVPEEYNVASALQYRVEASTADVDFALSSRQPPLPLRAAR